jgi:uncharacterized membrane protein
MAKLLGHPIHPMVIVFPLGLLATAVAFDIVGLAQADRSWFLISFWMIAAGIIGGLLAVVFGLLDWLGIPSGTRAKTYRLMAWLYQPFGSSAFHCQLVPAQSRSSASSHGRVQLGA